MGTDYRVDLYLVRHGITKANREKRYAGHTDVSLSGEAERQMQSLQLLLAPLPWKKILSSDLKRCTETLHLLLPGEDYFSDKRLREMYFGSWEMKTYEDLKHCPAYRRWVDNPLEAAPEQGESHGEFSGRVTDWLHGFLETASSGNYLAVTHAGVIRQLLVSLKAVPSFWDAPAPHGKAVVVRLEYREGDWLCTSLSVVPSQGKETILQDPIRRPGG